MAETFERYSDYYDSLYCGKKYGTECDYIENLWRASSPILPQTVLDIGCGTGGHALEFAARHYGVTGVDRSASMLAIARRKAADRKLSISFRENDIRSFQFPLTFDAAIAMFAVLGYITIDEDFCSALRCVRQHLKVGALFVFDLWYKEAVLSIGPEERILEFKHQGTTLKRHALPEIDAASSRISIHYTITTSSGTPLTRETHTVRFYSMTELRSFARNCGFELIASHPFMKPAEKLSNDEWNITCLLRAN